MTMTGDGAMSPEDIIYLRTGYFCFLPPDSKGRTVICYDPSRRVDHAKEARMRIGFFFWSIICENEASITDGYVGIVLLGNGSFGVSSLDGTIRECVDIVIDCFPTRSKNIHLVQTIRPTGTRRSWLEIVLPIILQVMGRILENAAGVSHVSESRREMAKEFEAFGLNANGLPVSAGGTWTYDGLYKWLLERCRLERQRYQQSISSGQHGQQQLPDHSASEGRSRRNVAPALSTMMVPSAVPSPTPSLTLLAGLTSANPFFPFQRQQPSQDASLHQLDYMIRRFSQADRAAYMDACARAPNLVVEESPPHWFVAHADGDVRAAARRLALYWAIRQHLFAERYLLPMAQTGEGALGRKDLILLNSGFFSVLPTKQNETVMLSYDCARDDFSDEGGRLRVAFYVLSLSAERELSRTMGLSIVASGLPEIAKLQREGGLTDRVTFRLLLEALPIRVSAIHIAMLLQPKMASFPLDESVQGMRHLFGTAGTCKAMVHVGTSRDEITEQLAPYGIGQSILPRCLGGTFGYDRFTQWQELRIRYEWGLPAGANDQDASEIYDFSTKVTPLTAMSEDEKKERKRRMNVVHSRRKRERERIEIEVLQEQCEEMRDRQAVLTEESRQLEDLWKDAQALALASAAMATVEALEDRKKSPAVNIKTA